MSSTGDRVSLPSAQTLQNCLSCKILCGGGLIVSGGYVYYEARKHVRGGMASVGTMAQIMFALGLVSVGLSVIMKPQKSQPKQYRMRPAVGDPLKPRDV